MPHHTTPVSPWGQGAHCKARGQQGAPGLRRGAPHISLSVQAALGPLAPTKHSSGVLALDGLAAVSTWEVTAHHPAVHLTLRISHLDLPRWHLSEAPVHLKFMDIDPTGTTHPGLRLSPEVPGLTPALLSALSSAHTAQGRGHAEAPCPSPRSTRGPRGEAPGTRAWQGARLLESRPLPPPHGSRGPSRKENGTQQLVAMATPKKQLRRGPLL